MFAHNKSGIAYRDRICRTRPPDILTKLGFNQWVCYCWVAQDALEGCQCLFFLGGGGW
jgi:hypothetical protein